MKEVNKASKRAKTFETQKVVKKLKDLGYELNSAHLLPPLINVSIGKKAIILRPSKNTKRN